MTPFSSTPKSTEKKCVRLCSDCDRPVDRDGYSNRDAAFIPKTEILRRIKAQESFGKAFG